VHTKGLGITNRILAEYVEMIMQSIPTSASTGKFPMSRQVRNHLADSRTTSLTCKALRRCPSAILAELAQRSNFGSIEPRSPMVRKTPRGLAPARVEQPVFPPFFAGELIGPAGAFKQKGTVSLWKKVFPLHQSIF